MYLLLYLQLYDCRQKAVCDDGQEKERFGQLTLDFMSEESSSDETMITIHSPEWRSESKLIFVKMPTMEVGWSGMNYSSHT